MASVVLNFALAGFASVLVIRDRGGSAMTRAVAEDVPPALRAAFRAAVAENRDAVMRAAQATRQAATQAHTELTAETLDVAALAAAQAAFRERAQELMSLVQAAVVRAAEQMPDAQRRQIPNLSHSALAAQRSFGPEP